MVARPALSGAAASKRRIVAGVVLALVIVAGLAVHRVLPESTFADIAGDALYVAAVYAALVLVAPRLRSWIAGLITLVWCVGIELFQLTGIPQQVGAVFPPAMLVLGTVFDGRDLVVYALTAVALLLIDTAILRRTTSRA